MEVEGSLQNPQKVKRAVQVPSCIFTVTITEGEGWISWLDLLAELTRSFNLFVLVLFGMPGSEEMRPTFWTSFQLIRSGKSSNCCRIITAT